MIISFKFSYSAHLKDLDPGDYAALRAVVTGLPEDPPDYWTSDVLMTDEVGLRKIAELKLGIEPQPYDGGMLVKLQDRIRALELDQHNTAQLLTNGAIVNIHVPDLALMMINEVDYLEDACTNLVQEKLDEGWRILAVCPPNAQRRPDYIFGRRK